MESSADRPLPQACAIPYRDIEGQIEFCLITSLSSKRWGFPKGMVDPGDSPWDTAVKETWEEAGLKGTLDGLALGYYKDYKWEIERVVTTFLLRVQEVAEEWPERTLRKRRWASGQDALSLVAKSEQKRLLAKAIERLSER